MYEISVALSSYNGAQYIEETIDSILSQTYKNFELILVDDGSEDTTPLIMDKYAVLDSRVKVIHQKNGGISKARETGYLAATGNYFIMSDDDNVWSANCLEELISEIKRFPKAQAAVAYDRAMYSDKEISSYVWGQEEDKIGEPEMITGKGFLELRHISYLQSGYGPCASWGILFKMDFMKILEEQFEAAKEEIPIHFLDDSFLTVCFSCCVSNLVISGQVLILYRIDTNSISHKKEASDYNKYIFYAVELSANRIKEKGWNELYEGWLLSLYFQMLRTWFMVKSCEGSNTFLLSEVERVYNKYYSEFLSIKYKGIDRAKVIFVRSWKYCPKLWYIFVRIAKRWQ